VLLHEVVGHDFESEGNSLGANSIDFPFVCTCATIENFAKIPGVLPPQSAYLAPRDEAVEAQYFASRLYSFFPKSKLFYRER